MQHYISQLEETLADTTDQSSDLKWARLHDAMYTSAITAYGKKEHKTADWYQAHCEEMEPVIEEKRKALLAYKAAPGPSTLTALRAARKKSQQTAHHCANTYRLNLCNSIQQANDFGDARGMYLDIRKATGPTPPNQPRSSPSLAIPSETKPNSWSAGLNITSSCMPPRIL